MDVVAGAQVETVESPKVAAEVALRDLAQDDLSYVYSTWLRDLRAEDHSPLPDDLWFPAHREAITRILASPGTKAVVATSADDRNEILGYAVATPDAFLHWVQIRKPFRGKKTGLVPALLAAVSAPPGTPASFRTPVGRALRNPPRPRAARPLFVSPVSPAADRKPSDPRR